MESVEPLGPQEVGMPSSTPEIDSDAEAANTVVGARANKARPTARASRCDRGISVSSGSKSGRNGGSTGAARCRQQRYPSIPRGTEWVTPRLDPERLEGPHRPRQPTAALLRAQLGRGGDHGPPPTLAKET